MNISNTNHQQCNLHTREFAITARSQTSNGLQLLPEYCNAAGNEHIELNMMQTDDDTQD